MSNFLEEGGPGDVNTDGGFNSFLARQAAQQAGVELSPDTLESLEAFSGEGTDVQSGLREGLETEESAPSGPARDDRGRFTPAAPAEEAEEGVAPSAEEEPDPLEALISEHGSERAALAALNREREGAQSLIGRLGNEAGEARDLRDRLARLEGQLAAQQQQAAPQAAPAPVSRDYLEDYVLDHGGQAAMRHVLEDLQRPELVDTVAGLWVNQEDPSEQLKANAWYARYHTWLAQQEFQQQAQEGRGAAPAADPRLEQLAQREQVREVRDQVKAEIGEGEWKLVTPHLEAVVNDPKTPEVVRDLIRSNDPESQKQGLVLAARLARTRVVETATQQVKQERQQAAESAKLGARVATGSLRSVPERQSGGGAVKDLPWDGPGGRHEMFLKSVLGAETTSVSDALKEGYSG